MKSLTIGFPFVGVVLISISTWLFLDSRQFVQEAEKASGTVIDFKERSSQDSYTYAPIVSYKTAANQTIEFVSSTSSNPPSHQAGETVDVLYIPNDPYDAEINSFFSLWGISLVFLSLGLIFLTLGFVFVYFYFKERKTKRR